MYMEKVVVNSYRLLIQTVRNNNCQHYNPIGYTDELLWDCGVKTKLCWHKQWLWTPQCNDRLNNKKICHCFHTSSCSSWHFCFNSAIWPSYLAFWRERERERSWQSYSLDKATTINNKVYRSKNHSVLGEGEHATYHWTWNISKILLK